MLTSSFVPGVSELFHYFGSQLAASSAPTDTTPPRPRGVSTKCEGGILAQPSSSPRTSLRRLPGAPSPPTPPASKTPTTPATPARATCKTPLDPRTTDYVVLAGGRSSIALRSRCGSVRGWPELSSHVSPGAAPHVGQRVFGCFATRRFFMRRMVSVSCS